MADPIVVRRALTLPLAPAQAWPLIADTGRFNRGLGLPELDVQPKEGLTRKICARFLGLKISWIEHPFEWVRPRFYRVRRDFPGGPLLRVEGGIELRPAPEGTEAIIAFALTPRSALGAALARFAAWKMGRDAESLLRSLAAKPASCLSLPARCRPRVDQGLLGQRAKALLESGVDDAAARRILDLLREGFDEDVSQMRPFELADRWGLDRCEVLRAFLHAVKAGLLELRWQLLCPCCLAGDISAALSDMKGKAHCPSCKIDYAVSMDESLELRFSAHPALRSVKIGTFCVGNPAKAPFALAQTALEAGGEKTLELDWPAESLVLRDMGGKRGLRLRPDGASSRVVADLAALPDDAVLSFRPGPGAVELRSAGPTLVRIETEEWRDRGAKASIVVSFQEFRNLFSAEVVSPGAELAIGRVTLLFSDLKGSTALYERIGDAPAYAVVRDHFDFLFEIVRKRRGAVVKTIGDAVMAVFSRPADGLEAALEIQERVAELNARLAPKPAIVIKLGLHEGPAIAINASGVLDYFGTTVNVAARVQNESAGADVVLSRRILDDPAARELLSSRGWREREFEIALKGLEKPYCLTRLEREAASSHAP